MLKENTSQPRILHFLTILQKWRLRLRGFQEANHLSLAGTLKGVSEAEKKKKGSKQKHNNVKRNKERKG